MKKYLIYVRLFISIIVFIPACILAQLSPIPGVLGFVCGASCILLKALGVSFEESYKELLGFTFFGFVMVYEGLFKFVTQRDLRY